MPEPKEVVEEEVQEIVEEEVAKRGGLGRLLLVILPVALVCLGGGGLLAYTQYARLANAAASMGYEVGAPPEEEENDDRTTYGQFATINELLINPAGSSGKHFLVVSLGIEARSGAVITELAERDIVVRDALLRLLSARTAEELSSIDLRSTIKEEIISELNSILQKGEIERLYFTQYLLQ